MDDNNYLYTCSQVISIYQKLYSESLDIDSVIESFDKNDVTALCEFRVFIDGCMLTFNKEKIDDTFSTKCDFDGFLKHINNDTASFRYIHPAIIRQQAIDLMSQKDVQSAVNVSGNGRVDLLYYSGNQTKSVRQQIKHIRNSFGHSQYSSFVTYAESGCVLGYASDNADPKHPNSNVDGYVIADLIHDLVLAFYSAYPRIGIPYRNTFVHKKGGLISKYYIKDIKMSANSNLTYDGFTDDHPMQMIPILVNEHGDVDNYINSHINDLEITLKPLSKIIKLRKIRRICKNYGFSGSGKIEENPIKMDLIKLMSNTEYMISNILTSVAYLNDATIDYLSGNRTKEDLSSVIAEIRNEDFESRLSNRIGFDILKSWLVSFMLDYEKDTQTAQGKTIRLYATDGSIITKLIDYSTLDVTCFDYDKAQLENYKSNHPNSSYPEKEFVMIRFRDALMHGHLKFETNKKHQLIIAFHDINPHNNNDVKIVSTSIEELEAFVDTTIKNSLSFVMPNRIQIV